MKRFLFWLARLRVSRFFISGVFAYMSWLISADRLHETETLIAFHHPRPSYPFHVLLVPKRPYTTLLDIPAEAPFLNDLLTVTQKVIRDHDLTAAGYRLITNGGRFQDVPHLHFHLISEQTVEDQV